MKFLTAVGALVATVAEAGERVPVYAYVDDWTLTGDALGKELVSLANAGVAQIILAFHLQGAGFPNDIADTVAGWAGIPDASRKSYLDQIHAAGTKLTVSSGGATEGAYWLSVDPTTYGSEVCAKLKALDVDGIDWDKEGFGSTTAEVFDWIKKATIACRSAWPEAIQTSAPQGPHMIPLGSAPIWSDLENEDGAAHDKYLIQYYNQGDYYGYSTYEGLFTATGKGSIGELYARYPDIDKTKFVVGKTFLPEDGAAADHMEVDALRALICKAWDELGYRGGLMFWKAHLSVGGDYSGFTKYAAPCDGSEPEPEPTVKPTTQPTKQPTMAPTTTDPCDEPTVQPTSPPTAKPGPATTTDPCDWPTDPAPTKPAPTNPAPTNPAPTNAAPTTTPQQGGSGDAVKDCEAMIKSSTGAYDDVCKGYCTQYSTSGDLSAWCPSYTDGASLAACVTSQWAFCTI